MRKKQSVSDGFKPKQPGINIRKIVALMIAALMFLGTFGVNLSTVYAREGEPGPTQAYIDIMPLELEPNQVWIYFMHNIPGDPGALSRLIATVGDRLTMPEDPVRAFYRVTGWRSTQQPALNRNWNFDTDRVPNIPGERLVLTAQWAPAPFRQEVRFHLYNPFGPQVIPNPVLRYAEGGIASTQLNTDANLNEPAPAPIPVWDQLNGGARFRHWGVSPAALYLPEGTNSVPFTMSPPPTTQDDVVPLDVVRYAVFEREVWVHYYDNSISESVGVVGPFLANDLASYNITAQLVPLQSGVRHVLDGQPTGAPAGVHLTRAYDFRNWYVNEARTVPFVSLIQLTFDSNGVANIFAGYSVRATEPGPLQPVNLIYHNEGANEDVEFYVPQNVTLVIVGEVNRPISMPNALFRGWTVGTDESRDFWVSGSPITGPTVLEAIFSHTVTIDLAGGVFAASPSNDRDVYAAANYVFTLPGLTGVTPVQYGAALTGVIHPYSPIFRRPDNPTRTGNWEFDFWTLWPSTLRFVFEPLELPNSNGTTHYATNVQDNMRFIARWEPSPRVTLTFYGGGGTPASFVRTPARGSTTSNLQWAIATSMTGNIERPMIPRHDGFHFTGWRDNASPHDIWTFGTSTGNRIINDHHSFTAQWEPGFTVTFHSGGAGFSNGQFLTHQDNATTVRRTVPQGESGAGARVTAPPLMRVGGSGAVGWYEDVNDPSTRWNFNDNVTRDMELTPVWVRFDASPGAFFNSTTRVLASPINRIITSPPVGNAVPLTSDINAVYRRGYSLVGWEYNGQIWNFNNQVYAGQVFNARWQRTAIVTFHSPLQNNVWTHRTANLNNNMLITMPGTPLRTNFEFTGWFTNPQATGEPWNPSTPVHNDMNLYAGWLYQYSVLFLLSANPRVGHQVINGIQEGSLIPTPAPIPPDRRGAFAGWYIYGTNPAVPWNLATDRLTRENFMLGSANGGPNPGAANPFTLIARWNYFPVVTLVFRDGSELSIMTRPDQSGQFFAPLPTIPRYNLYTALGWFERDENGNSTGPQITNRTPITRNMRLYAEYERHSHNVTFVLGYDKADYVSPHGHGSTIIVPRHFAHPTNPEYSVVSWYLDPQRTNRKPSDFTVTEDVRLYARWGAIQYADVIFRNVYGDTIAETTVRFGNAITNFPPVFDPQNRFVFENYWYVGNHGGEVWNTGRIVAQTELILIASARHIVVFNANSGQLAPGTRQLEIRHGNGINPQDMHDPSREGYTFLGWFTTPATGGYEWAAYGQTPHDVVRVNMTLYARWRVVEDNQPTSAPWSSLPSGCYPHGFQFRLLHENPSARIYFTRDGTDPITSQTRIRLVNPITINEDMTIKAVAIVDGYDYSEVVTYNYCVQLSTVTFDTQGGMPQPDSVTVYTTRGLFAPPQPTRGNYEFMGWYYGEIRWNFINQVPNNEVSIVRGDMTLTARWDDTPSDIAVPRSSLPSGEYPRGFQFVLRHDNPNAIIHFTNDGTVPTVDSTVYVNPITITGNMTIKAIAVVNGQVSGVAVYHYTIPGTTPTPSPTPAPEGRITALAMDGLNGIVNNSNNTITFRMPEAQYTGSIWGYITNLVADSHEVIFVVSSYPGEHPRSQGDLAGFTSGDTVFVQDGVVYTLIIEMYPQSTPGRIYAMSMDGIAGVINQTNATITFDIPSTLMTSGSFLGTITNLSISAPYNEVLFIIYGFGNEEFVRSQGDLAGFGDGDIVFVADGIIYTIRINVIQQIQPADYEIALPQVEEELYNESYVDDQVAEDNMQDEVTGDTVADEDGKPDIPTIDEGKADIPTEDENLESDI